MRRGYPHHFFFALGHLAEAEDESVKQFPKLAAWIRDQRLQWQEDAAYMPMWGMMIALVLWEMRKLGKLPKNYEQFTVGPCNVGCLDCPAAKRGRA